MHEATHGVLEVRTYNEAPNRQLALADGYRVLFVGPDNHWMASALQDLGNHVEIARNWVLDDNFDIVVVVDAEDTVAFQKLLDDINPDLLEIPWWNTNPENSVLSMLWARWDEVGVDASSRTIYEATVIPWRINQQLRDALNSASWSDRVWT